MNPQVAAALGAPAPQSQSSEGFFGWLGDEISSGLNWVGSELEAGVNDVSQAVGLGQVFATAQSGNTSPTEPNIETVTVTASRINWGNAWDWLPTPNLGNALATHTPRYALSMYWETLPHMSLGQEDQAAAIVSSGRGDPGGVSYGAFQLSSHGSVQAFVNSAEGSPWAGQFMGLNPHEANGAFASTWQAIAAQDSTFFDAQAAYAQRIYYDPVANSVLAQTGVDVNNLSDGVQNAVWSTAVNNTRGAVGIISTAIDEANLSGLDPSSLEYNEAVINNIYDVRSMYVAGQPQLYPNTVVSLENRYAIEQQQALLLAGP